MDGALWAYRAAYKTPIKTSLYTFVFGKPCYLPVELEHKTYWALHLLNWDKGKSQVDQTLELNIVLEEFHTFAYDNVWIYKERMKRIHDKHIQ